MTPSRPAGSNAGVKSSHESQLDNEKHPVCIALSTHYGLNSALPHAPFPKSTFILRHPLQCLYMGLTHWLRMQPAFVARDSSLTDVIAVQLLQQTQAATYICLCALTASMWDWTLSLEEELRIVKRCGRSPAVFAYFLARTSAVMLCAFSLVLYTKVSPDDNSCSTIFDGVGIAAMLASAAKAYLFLIRVRAIYGNSKLVTLLVGMGWLAVVSARMTVPSMVHTAALEQTGHCAVTYVGSLPIISMWMNVAYDTCIFISITARLTSYTKSTTTPWIPPFSTVFPRDGQFYYCVSSITVCFALLPAIIAVSSVHPIYQAIFAVPANAIEIIMTCKVFRAMIIRSLHAAQNVDMSLALAEACTTAMSIIELDTCLELRIRTMNTERD
ncbi:hypothetical protein FIBSPDRAFT_937905 [Athelia psychrophila]|uniref:DUF6533 domain-containing protein n=1 Tax=Athelia psychrophila TaxID=1759441 RepID=A0A165ZKA5_9AGAM|nr:hypothetical protein FIBSPDRAFT_937905 [Fibularhizoctonia sp. CBS 109695]